MRENAKRKKSRARPGFVREAWRTRVHQAFARYWSSLKTNRNLPKFKDQRQTEFQLMQWAKEFAEASRDYDEARDQINNPIGPKIQSIILKRLDIEGPLFVPPAIPGQEATSYPGNPESSPIFRKLVFLKYAITFPELIYQIDIEKDPAAHQKLMAVHRDYWRLKSGRTFNDFKLKFSMDHFDILTQGLDFGLDKLTPDELADCLNEICPCGLKHSPEYLKKLKGYIKRTCEHLLRTDRV